VEGVVLNQSQGELQLLGDDRAVHLLREGTSGRFREVTSQTDWPTYNGHPNGNRYSLLAQITAANASRLEPKWIFTLPNAAQLQVTPVVVEGVMYVTAANDVYALDAGSGRQVWNYRRPRTRGLGGVAARGVNRGVAVGGDRVFMATDHAHLIALNRATGALLWETEMADWRQNYNGTGAPLVVDGLVISGIAGGDEGVRGFVAAFDQNTGREVWRFWAVPARGEPGAETWKGSAIDYTRSRHVDDRQLRPPAGHAVLGDRQPRAGHDRGRSAGRQPLLGFGGGARREDRAPQVAFPVHAPRRARLRRTAAAGAGGRTVEGPAAEAPAAGQP